MQEPALASLQLLLCKCLLFPSRWESKDLPLLCRQKGHCMAEPCLTTHVHTHTQTGFLGLSDKFPLLLPCSASPWAQLIPLHSPFHPSYRYTRVKRSPGSCDSSRLHASPMPAHGPHREQELGLLTRATTLWVPLYGSHLFKPCSQAKPMPSSAHPLPVSLPSR